MRRSIAVLALTIGIGNSGTGLAADVLGVPAYAGAKEQPGSAKMITDMIKGSKARCFSTADRVEQVVAYYKKHGLTYAGGDKVAGYLKKGKVDVSVESFWFDPKTGEKQNSTMLCMVQPSP